MRVEGRPYTTIETNLVKRMIEVVLADAELAFKPLSPVKFNIDRLETNPRFAAISRPANAAILVRLRIDMEDRGGNIELLLPYATIEPIRDVLLQMFMGEKFGRDQIWEGHLATEIGQAEIAVDAVLYEAQLPLRQMMELEVGDTLMLELKPDALVTVRCGDVALTEGRMGRVGDRVAVRVAKPLAQAENHLRHVRKGGRNQETDGGTSEQPLRIDDRKPGRGPAAADHPLLRAAQQRSSSGSRPTSSAMKATIAELITATENAERAIAGLKATVREAEDTLGERLRDAEQFSIDIVRNTEAGEEVLNRLAQIAGVHLARTGAPHRELGPPDAPPKSICAAAQAFAERAPARAIKGIGGMTALAA